MSTTTRTVRLAGLDLGDLRHLCALVEGPDEANDVLLPFILEGFEQGDRAVHLVDPAGRDEHLARLREGGIDVQAATESRQLDVRTWTDTYLSGGRFDRTAQFARVRDSLDEGRALGYPKTRFIGLMEWAVEAEPLNDLLAYERRLETLLRRRSDVVVCAYDLKRHSARAIAGVLGAHVAALVGGALRTSPAAPESARERILEAASQLFQERGVQATGVDALVAAAGVAKATFYRHFKSKDDLVVAWLRDPRTRWLDHVRTDLDARAPDAAARIPMFFDAVADWLAAGRYRGCPYMNTAFEIPDPAHPAQPIIKDFLQEVEDVLDGLIAAAGYRDSRRLATEVQTLTAGAISLAVARRSSVSVDTARGAAMRLLEDAERA
jgi:AcrR family transcriptional regulator